MVRSLRVIDMPQATHIHYRVCRRAQGEPVNYRLLKKKLALPGDFKPPVRLIHDDVVATAISRADLQDDVRGVAEG
jgi:hypothetical protein